MHHIFKFHPITKRSTGGDNRVLERNAGDSDCQVGRTWAAARGGMHREGSLPHGDTHEPRRHRDAKPTMKDYAVIRRLGLEQSFTKNHPYDRMAHVRTHRSTLALAFYAAILLAFRLGLEQSSIGR